MKARVKRNRETEGGKREKEIETHTHTHRCTYREIDEDFLDLHFQTSSFTIATLLGGFWAHSIGKEVTLSQALSFRGCR